jgi:hypothetical protein
MGYWRIRLTCGCRCGWEEPSRNGDLPGQGQNAYCPEHGHVSIRRVFPRVWIWREIPLSPDQDLVIAWDAQDCTWAFWTETKGPSDEVFTGPVTDGFESAADALAAAVEIYFS